MKVNKNILLIFYFIFFSNKIFSNDIKAKKINDIHNENPHFFSPYSQITEYDLNTNDNLFLKISKLTNSKSFIFAFIQESGKCKPAWDGDKENIITSKKIIQFIKSIKINKINYKISFGGAHGKDLSLKCKKKEDLLKVYIQTIELYQPIGLDFDLEGDILLNKAAVKNILSTIFELQKNYKNISISFTLPVMPNGFSSLEKKFIKMAKQKNIIFNVNLLIMNYSNEFQNNMSKYSISAAINSYKYLKKIYPKNIDAIWKKIEMTPMIGVNDIKEEVFTIQDAIQLKSFSLKNKMGGMHFWSLERDKPCKKNKLSNKCSGLPEQKPYEFTQIFSNLRYQ